jgi:RNA polymerase sigma-70 factor (ECF subfamily)
VTADPAGPPETDAAVIRQSLAEPERFEEVFRRWFTRIHQYLAGRVGSRIADDRLTAEVFISGVLCPARAVQADLDSAGPWLPRHRHRTWPGDMLAVQTGRDRALARSCAVTGRRAERRGLLITIG